MKSERKQYAPSTVPESHKPYRASLRNVAGLPRENIEDAFADARAMGVGATVRDAEGTILARWVNAMTKGWWKTGSDEG